MFDRSFVCDRVLTPFQGVAKANDEAFANVPLLFLPPIRALCLRIVCM